MPDLTDMMQEWSVAFDKLCQERHAAGAAEYGQFTFLENDVVRMMAEELADTANYCRMQFIKLMILQRALEEQIEGSVDPDAKTITLGMQSFKGTGDTGWGK